MFLCQIQILYHLLFALSTCTIQGVNQRTAMISFDEGPSKNFETLLGIAVDYQIPIVFHLDPTLASFTKEKVDKIISYNFEVGMSVTESIESNQEEVIRKYTEAFISKTGYRPVLVRVLRGEHNLVGNYFKSMGYVLTTPTIDSEDDQKAEVYPFIAPELQSLCGSPTSISFRDRYSTSVKLLPHIIQLLEEAQYVVVPAYEFLGLNTNLHEVKEEDFTIKVSINTVDKKINVIGYDSKKKIIKEEEIPLDSENKLKVRDLTDKTFTKIEFEKVFEDLKELKKAKEDVKDEADKNKESSRKDGEVTTAHHNGIESWDKCFILYSLLLGLFN
ncbi:Polysaccharide deacetylase [Nosema bombycis CQ1]|uniref:Polysaccharide deacetylase n=1 Tax=Nosema bombycis (strain CQ1 / CVCC 102059) TaxID=578461 RepID=R0MIC7_NOSB1|nr:Polysaccharide deacetylase [Nosema bombycis CQ1]|eukprot:EOB13880.1 Polysaccharide deacetylase [Nosema bombycis CQ1]